MLPSSVSLRRRRGFCRYGRLAGIRSQRYVPPSNPRCTNSRRGHHSRALSRRALRQASPAQPPTRPEARTPILPCRLRDAVGAAFVVVAREAGRKGPSLGGARRGSGVVVRQLRRETLLPLSLVPTG